MSRNISIIIPTNDDNIILREMLPLLLSQQYDSAYEVIVVRETRQGAMKDILEPLLSTHKNLVTTYLPDRPQYISMLEVELLLGVKAAHYEDIIVITPSFTPESELWVKDVFNILSNHSNQQLIFGNAHYYNQLSFFRRLSHNRRVSKLLKPWCKQHGINISHTKADKEERQMFSLHFHRQDYLNDLPLRHIIHCHIDAY